MVVRESSRKEETAENNHNRGWKWVRSEVAMDTFAMKCWQNFFPANPLEKHFRLLS